MKMQARKGSVFACPRYTNFIKSRIAKAIKTIDKYVKPRLPISAERSENWYSTLLPASDPDTAPTKFIANFKTFGYRVAYGKTSAAGSVIRSLSYVKAKTIYAPNTNSEDILEDEINENAVNPDGDEDTEGTDMLTFSEYLEHVRDKEPNASQLKQNILAIISIKPDLHHMVRWIQGHHADETELSNNSYSVSEVCCTRTKRAGAISMDSMPVRICLLVLDPVRFLEVFKEEPSESEILESQAVSRLFKFKADLTDEEKIAAASMIQTFMLSCKKESFIYIGAKTGPQINRHTILTIIKNSSYFMKTARINSYGYGFKSHMYTWDDQDAITARIDDDRVEVLAAIVRIVQLYIAYVGEKPEVSLP